MADEKYVKTIVDLIGKYPNHYSSMLQSGKNEEICRYIKSRTRFLDGFRFSTRCWYAVNGLNDFVKCKKCGKPVMKDIRTFAAPMLDYCCGKCMYGSESFKNAVSEGCRRMTNEQISAKTANCRRTKLTRYGDSNYRNDRKRVLTLRRHYGNGVVNPFQADDVKKRIRQTCLEKYGCESYAQREECALKAKATNRKRYGVDFHSRLESEKEKARLTCLKKFGGGSPMSSPCVRGKSRATCRNKYGVDFPSQNREIRLKAQKRYAYSGVNFDSGPELAMYIWLSDNNADFEYQPGISFSYEYAGSTHLYCPDFLIGGKLYELKGGHMTSEDGKWICPWDRSKDGKYEAKRKCAVGNGVTVISDNEYCKYVDYVNEKYGKDYLKSFRRI